MTSQSDMKKHDIESSNFNTTVGDFSREPTSKNKQPLFKNDHIKAQTTMNESGSSLINIQNVNVINLHGASMNASEHYQDSARKMRPNMSSSQDVDKSNPQAIPLASQATETQDAIRYFENISVIKANRKEKRELLEYNICKKEWAKFRTKLEQQELT